MCGSWAVGKKFIEWPTREPLAYCPDCFDAAYAQFMGQFATVNKLDHRDCSWDMSGEQMEELIMAIVSGAASPV